MQLSPAKHVEARERSLIVFWVVISALGLSLVGFGGVYSWVWMPVALFLFLALAAMLIACLRNNEPVILPGISIPLFAFGFVVLSQLLFHWTLYPAATRVGLMQLSGGGAVFILGCLAFQYSDNVARLGKVLWMVTGILSLEAVLQFFTANGMIFWFRDASYASPVGPFVYHNHFAGYMDLIWPVGFVWALNRHDQHRGSAGIKGVLLAIFPVLGVTAMIISQSRGGFIILVLEGILILLLFARTKKRKRSESRNLKLVLMLVLVFGAAAGSQPIWHRLTDLGASDASVSDRIAVDKACLQIIRDYWQVGTGFNTFPVVYPQYATVDSGRTWNQAHNEYLQAIVETGLPGLLCIVTFLVLAGRDVIRLYKLERHRTETLQLAIAIGCCGFLAHSLIDFQFHAPANMLLFFALISALSARPNKKRLSAGEPTRSRSKAAIAPEPV